MSETEVQTEAETEAETVQTQVTEQVKRTNPLLAKVTIPGETFRLPSSGLFYTSGELDDSVKDGEVMVNAMTAMDELLLKSPDKLLSGESVTDVIANCLPDVRKPAELLAKDIDYLLMCLRLVSYGPNIELTQSHDCEDAKEHSYSVPLRPFVSNAKPLDPTSLDRYKIKLSNGQVCDLHPPRFIQTIKVYQLFGTRANEEEIDAKVLGEQLIETIGDMVDAVDGHTNRDDIQEWLKQLRVGDVQKISDAIAELSDWGADPIAHVECKDCGEKFDLVVPVNPVSFFM